MPIDIPTAQSVYFNREKGHYSFPTGDKRQAFSTKQELLTALSKIHGRTFGIQRENGTTYYYTLVDEGKFERISPNKAQLLLSQNGTPKKWMAAAILLMKLGAAFFAAQSLPAVAAIPADPLPESRVSPFSTPSERVSTTFAGETAYDAFYTDLGGSNFDVYGGFEGQNVSRVNSHVPIAQFDPFAMGTGPDKADVSWTTVHQLPSGSSDILATEVTPAGKNPYAGAGANGEEADEQLVNDDIGGNDQTTTACHSKQAGKGARVYAATADDSSGFSVRARHFNLTDGGFFAPSKRINTQQNGYQWYPKCAIRKDGYTIYVYETEFQDGDGFGIAMVIEDPNGNEVFVPGLSGQNGASGNEIIVNYYTTGNQVRPAVILVENEQDPEKEDIIVCWTSDGQINGKDIICKRYGPDFQEMAIESSTLPGNEFILNDETEQDQEDVQLAADGAHFGGSFDTNAEGPGWDVLVNYFGRNTTKMSLPFSLPNRTEFFGNQERANDQRESSIAFSPLGKLGLSFKGNQLGGVWQIFRRIFPFVQENPSQTPSSSPSSEPSPDPSAEASASPSPQPSPNPSPAASASPSPFASVSPSPFASASPSPAASASPSPEDEASAKPPPPPTPEEESEETKTSSSTEETESSEEIPSKKMPPPLPPLPSNPPSDDGETTDVEDSEDRSGFIYGVVAGAAGVCLAASAGAAWVYRKKIATLFRGEEDANSGTYDLPVVAESVGYGSNNTAAQGGNSGTYANFEAVMNLSGSTDSQYANLPTVPEYANIPQQQE